MQAMDEYAVVRMRGEELAHAAEQARLAGEARRSAPAADRPVAQAVVRVRLAAAKVWHGRRRHGTGARHRSAAAR
jgi:hypothetical protein